MVSIFSNAATWPFSTSVRSGLVITSTNCSLPCPIAGTASNEARSAANNALFILSSLVFAAGNLRWPPSSILGASERLLQLAPQILDLLEPDMQAHRARRHAEIAERVRPAGLLQGEQRGNREALMPTPADAELEERQRV